MYSFLRHPQRFQRKLGVVHHRRRAADKGFVEQAEIDQRFSQLLQFFAVDTPVQQFTVEGLLTENIHQLQTLRPGVFQVRQRLAKHHALAAAVAVNQGEMALRLDPQGAGDNRQHRRDP
ncbi:hypothetical protein D3C81_1816120 [compost metagenome]